MTCIPITNGIICLAKTDFNCPICGCLHTEGDYMYRLERSKRGFIYRHCKGCKQWIGITSDIRGDIRVWEKKTEVKLK